MTVTMMRTLNVAAAAAVAKGWPDMCGHARAAAMVLRLPKLVPWLTNMRKHRVVAGAATV